MPFILSIDTALDTAGICIAENERIIDSETNERQMDHASWIHTAIRDMLARNNIQIKQLAAVAVTSGPGSYTGLRVGMATAKGICYTLKIPLVTETSLYLIATAVKNSLPEDTEERFLICPMIDARRMEVFTIVFDQDLNETISAFALILDQSSFEKELAINKMIFAGNGMEKWKNISTNHNAVFSEERYQVSDLAEIAYRKFLRKEFTDLAYSEPFYLKSFYTGVSK